MMFTNFLEETIARPFASISAIVCDIYDSFEVALPTFLQKNRGVCRSDQSFSSHSTRNSKSKSGRLERKSTLDSQVSSSSASLDSTKRLAFDRMRLAHRQKEMKLSSIRDGNAKPFPATKGLANSKKLFPSSVKIARRHKSSNPMLVGSRREYVGGHFTNKLSNVSTIIS